MHNRMANTVASYQTAQGLHCLARHVCAKALDHYSICRYSLEVIDVHVKENYWTRKSNELHKMSTRLEKSAHLLAMASASYSRLSKQ